MRGPRIQISVSRETYKDCKARKDFNCSRFFEMRYREEFLDEQGLRDKIEYHKKELQRYTDRLMGIKDEKIVKPTYESTRCPVCNMFFQEKIAIRKKTHIYKSLYVCYQCSLEQKMHIDKMVLEMKTKEGENVEEQN